MMLLTILMKLLGVPIFGTPNISEQLPSIDQVDHSLYVSGRIISRKQTANAVQYVLADVFISEKKPDQNNQIETAETANLKNQIKTAETANLKKQIKTAKEADQINLIQNSEESIQNNLIKNEKQSNQNNQIESVSLDYILVTMEKGTEYTIGSKVMIFGDPEMIEGPENPGQFDQRAYYAAQKIFCSVWADHMTVVGEPEAEKNLFRRLANSVSQWMTGCREQVTIDLQKVMGERQAGILASILLGDREALQEESKINFQMGGLTHVLAISGLHISMIGQAAFLLLQYLGLPLMFAAPLSVLLIMIYCIFVGSPASAVRAMIMFLVMMGARMTKRSYDLLSALALAGILMLVSNPNILFYAGFQMSFAAVVGAGLIYPTLNKLIPPEFWRKGSKKKKILEKCMQSVFSYTAIMLTTMPVVAYYFYEIPVLGIFSNLLLLPLVGMIIVSGIAGTFLLGLVYLSGKIRLLWYLTKFILLPANILLALFEKVTALMRTFPFSTWICGQPDIWQVAVYYVCLGISVYLIRTRQDKSEGKNIAKNTIRIKNMRRSRDVVTDRDKVTAREVMSERNITPWFLHGNKQAKALAVFSIICGLTILFWRSSPDFHLTMLAVGQGDGLVLRQKNLTYLVDGGSSSENKVGMYRILPYLKQQGISHLEGMIISHADSDHYNGIEEILLAMDNKETSLQVDYLLMPAWMKTDADGIRLEEEAEAVGIQVSYLATGDRISSLDPESTEGDSSESEAENKGSETDEQGNKNTNAIITDSSLSKKDQRSGNCDAGMEIEVLYPSVNSKVDGNEGSLVLEVNYGEFSALLTGDLEGQGEEAVTDYANRTNLDIDLLKVAHHGSKNSTSQEFLQALKPELCLISAPENSTYGHPHQELLNRLKAAGAAYLVTKDYGAISVESDGKEYWVLANKQ